MKEEPKPTESMPEGDFIGFHAEYIAVAVVAGVADHYGLCVRCLAKATIKAIEERLANIEEKEHRHEDGIGEPRGSA